MAIRSLSAQVVHLEFVEALFRRPVNHTVLSTIFGGVLAELQHIYPTYRFHITKGKIAYKDQVTIQAIAEALSAIIDRSQNYRVFAPIGFGKHVDHVIVHTICKNLFLTMLFWSDYPYNQSIVTDNLRGYDHYTLSGDESAKTTVIQEYKSQARAMFGTRELPNLTESYYISRV